MNDERRLGAAGQVDEQRREHQVGADLHRRQRAGDVPRARQRQREDDGEPVRRDDEPEQRRRRPATSARRRRRRPRATSADASSSVTRPTRNSMTYVSRVRARSANGVAATAPPLASDLMLPAILKIGRYIAMMRPPTMTPRNTIITGSISEVSAADGGVDFLFVEVGDLLQHRVHRAGLLADADHLHDHRREHLRLGERLGHVLAFGDLLRART